MTPKKTTLLSVAGVPGALSAAVSGVGSAVPPEVTGVHGPSNKGVCVPGSVGVALESVKAENGDMEINGRGILHCPFSGFYVYHCFYRQSSTWKPPTTNHG